LAVLKGYSKGFVIAIFSFLGLFIGLAAALKLSAVVADYLEHHVVNNSRWLPLLSFFLVFLAVVFIVSLGAGLIRKTLRIVTLGWLDRIAGVLLYVAIYIIIFSILLFYAEKMFLLKAEVVSTSRTYRFVAPWGPLVIDNLGKIIPVFKGLFGDLQEFFEGFTKKEVATVLQSNIIYLFAEKQVF
jgi:membrane protein required for colicin V production